MLMGANDGAVDEHLFEICVLRQLGEDAMPDTTPRPASKSLIDTIPRPEWAWQVTPRTTRASNPQNRFNELSIIGRRAPRVAGFTRQQGRYPLKLIITQPQTYHHPDATQKSGYDHISTSVNSPLVTH
jgi:hypothetical protein